VDGAPLVERVAPAIEERLRLLHPGAGAVRWSVEADPEHGGHQLVAERRRQGLPVETVFDTDFLRSPEYQHLRTLAGRMDQIGEAPFRIVREREDEPQVAPSAPALLERVLQIAQKGISIQRYKGLGEMNAEQLADTTMNPANRTLLQVKLEDEVEAEEAFSTLMGDEVEPRREFIEKNALEVQNLDI
jgi:DNA gyrase subunit B